MKRSFVFFTSILATSAARAADIGTTYAFSPDLLKEGNWLMAPLGYRGIITLNILLVLASSLLLFFWFRFPLLYRLPSDPTDVWAFASLNYFGDEGSFGTFVRRFLSRNPKNWLMAAQMVAIQLPIVLIVGSALAVFSWFAIHQWKWSWYNELYGRSHFVFPYFLIVPCYVLATRWYFRMEHLRTLDEHSVFRVKPHE